jgi:hypothetical protein
LIFADQISRERGIDVAIQALDEFHHELTQPFLLRDVLPGPAWAPYQAGVRPLPRNTDFAAEACEEDGNCIKGFLVAICMEGAAALGVYGIWQIWHLFR